MYNYILFTNINHILNVVQEYNICGKTDKQLIKMSNEKRNSSDSLINYVNCKLNIVILFFAIISSVHCAENGNAIKQKDVNHLNSPDMNGAIEDTQHGKLFETNEFMGRQSWNFVDDIKSMVLNYVDEALNRKSYEIISGLKIELDKRNFTNSRMINAFDDEPKSFGSTLLSFDEQLLGRLQHFAETHVINLNIPQAAQTTGRLFFFKGR